MLDKRIRFEEKYVDEEYETTTLYFMVPKELIIENHPNIEAIRLSVEFPTAHPEPRYATVEFTPIEDGEYYGWFDIDLPYDEIEELIKLAEEEIK